MTDDRLERVKKEIERQKAQWKICKSSEAKYRLEMLDDISDFIDSLQEVPCNHCQGSNDKEKCDELVFGYNCPIVKKPVSEGWHDASEEPNGKEYVIAWDGKYASIACYKSIVNCKWCYLSDILPNKEKGV